MANTQLQPGQTKYIFLLGSSRKHVSVIYPPLNPIYIVNLYVYTEVYIFLSKTWVYSLEPPRRVTTINVLGTNIKICCFFFSIQCSFFPAEKNLCIMHRQVSVLKIFHLRRFCGQTLSRRNVQSAIRYNG